MSDSQATGTGILQEPGRVRALRAGALTLALDGASVRWIRLGDQEILRGIYVGVRDRYWRTIPAAIRSLNVDAREDSFRVELVAEHRHLDVDFRWRGTIVGERNGVVTFTMDGTAQQTFLKNRIGFCVLHPMQECSGRPCTIEHVDGHIASTSFPSLVSPHQAFREVRAIAHEVTPGVIAEVRVDGDVFETEDQRNWSDTSFKTYSTPVDLPFPVEVAAGTRVRQEVRLRVRGAGGGAAVESASKSPVRIEISDANHGIPRIGLMVDATRPLPPEVREHLRALQLSHLRVDLDLGDADGAAASGSPADERWKLALGEAASQAGALGAALQIAASVSSVAPHEALIALAESAAALSVAVDAWLLFDRATGTTPQALLTAAREVFAGVGRTAARIGGGSNVHFADLNRNRPPAALLDLLAYPMSPQAHATDAETMVENIGSIASVVETARSFARGSDGSGSGSGSEGVLPVALTPVTLKPRSKSGMESVPPLGALPDHLDARQATPFAAAWTLSHLRACVEAGVQSVTYFRTVGLDGIIEPEQGAPMPIFHALAAVAPFAGAGGRALVTRSSDPQRVDALCVERDGARRLLVINLRAEPQTVRLPSPFQRDDAAPRTLRPFEILTLDSERRQAM